MLISMLYNFSMENNLVKVSNPYNDQELEFNNDTGRYQLSLAYVKGLFDECPIKNDATIERRIKDTARIIYNYIYNHCYSGNKGVVNTLLNYTENGRKFLKEVMAIQIESDFLTGINSLGKLPTINMGTGAVLDRALLQLNQVCVQAEDEMKNSHNYFAGINLLYQAAYPYTIHLMVK